MRRQNCSVELQPAAVIVAALVTLTGVLVVALFSRRHERQHMREVLLEPAEKYGEAVLAAMAALRYMNPKER